MYYFYCTLLPLADVAERVDVRHVGLLVRDGDLARSRVSADAHCLEVEAVQVRRAARREEDRVEGLLLLDACK